MIRTYGWLCFLLLLTHSPTLWAKAKDPAPQPLAFAIEGGVSMGAYEAGVVWGYVSLIKLRYERWVCEHNRSLDAEARRYCDKWVTKLRKIEKAHNMTLRSMLPVPYRLSSVSGASAGNANSLLAFLHWYKKGIGGVHHNILWDGWVPAGWTGLFPGKRTCAQYNKDMEESLNVMVNKVGLSPKDMHINCQPKKGVYLPDDGLLTRLGAHPTRMRIKKELQAMKVSPIVKHIFKEGKKGKHFRVALPIARVKAKIIHSQGIKYTSQNAHIAFRIKLNKGKVTFVQDDTYYPSWDQRRVYLREDAKGTVPFSNLYQVVEASAAFPIAFGAKQLSVCEETGPDGLKACRQKKQYRNAYFFDGGTYENLPFGLAATMLDQRASGARLLATNLNRGSFESKEPPNSRPQRFEEFLGLQAIIPFFTGFVTTARSYERDVFLREQRTLTRRASIIKRVGKHRQQRRNKRALRAEQASLRYLRLWIKYLTLQQKTLPKNRASRKKRAQLEQKLLQAKQKIEGLQAKIKAAKKRLFDTLPKKLPSHKVVQTKLSSFLLPHRWDQQVSHHLVGFHLGWFASFLGKHFRAFDYHIGVYDAMLQVATGRLRYDGDQIKRPREVVAQMKLLMELLGTTQSQDSFGRWVFRQAMKHTISRHKEHELTEKRLLLKLRTRFQKQPYIARWMVPDQKKPKEELARELQSLLRKLTQNNAATLHGIRQDALSYADSLLKKAKWDEDKETEQYDDIKLDVDVLQSLGVVLLQMRKPPSVVIHKLLDRLLYTSSPWRKASVIARSNVTMRKEQVAFQAAWEKAQKEVEKEEHKRLPPGTYRRQFSSQRDLYSSILKADGFLYFLEDVSLQLKRRNKVLANLPLDSVEKALLNSPRAWLRDTFSVMLSRMWKLEDIARNDNGKRLALMGMFVVDTDRKNHELGFFEASTISHYHLGGLGAISRWLLPMRFGLTTYQESPSIELLWTEAMLAWSEHSALAFPFLRFNLASDSYSLSPIGIYYRYRTQSIFFSGFAIGVQLDFGFIQPDQSKDFRFVFGPTPEVAAYFFADKLRIGVGYQIMYEPLATEGSPWIPISLRPLRGLGLSITVNDFKGIFYWMVRFITAAR